MCVLLVAVTMAAACVGIEGEKFSPVPDVVASIENGTPNGVDGIRFEPVLWKPADNINVFYGSVGVKYTSRNEEEASSATFGAATALGVTKDGLANVWGFRPYDRYAVCSGEGVTAALPAVQYGVTGSYDDGLVTALAHSETTDLHFINVCGGIRFKLPLDSISTITITSNAGEALAGKALFSFSEGGDPIVAAVDSADKITLVPESGEFFQKDSEYSFVTLPVVMADGFTMSFGKETAEGAKVGFYEYRPGPVTVSRSEFTMIEIPDSIAFLSDLGWHYREVGEEVLKENARREGTVVLPSGLQYRIIKEGDKEKPSLDSLLKMHFTMAIVQTGQTLQDTRRNTGPRPIEVPFKQWVSSQGYGWMEILQLFPEGSICEFLVPYRVMFGDEVIPAVPQNSVMKFRVELYDHTTLWPADEENKTAGEKFLEENAKNDSVIVCQSGLQYKVLTAGSGEKPQEGDMVKVHYWGKLLDGTVFDSSYARGEPITFSPRGVIPGWTEALMLMPKGSKWEVYIPYQLGYGARDQGPIPAYSLLIFQIELLDIQPE
ncbi:MAG: FKBP-type peptidyl-prolyl cis-trans isomerase [Bacteroidales bacterium]|nr:FKBP-type peptidyl-prolyl cis-trans isomerase [Bacteroidales bacterium]